VFICHQKKNDVFKKNMNDEIKRGIVAGIGVLALIWTAISLILLIFVRDKKTIIIPASPHTSVIPSRVPDGIYNIGKISLNQRITIKQITNIISAVASVVPTVTKPITSVDNIPPLIPPNMINSTNTLSQPLQKNPQTLGFVTMTQNSSFLFASLPNGEVGFGSWYIDQEKKQYVFDKDSYSGKGLNTNRIAQSYVPKGESKSELELNTSASAVGCVGPSSIVLSDDSLRLYVAYRDSNIGSDNAYPFGQSTGKIQVWYSTSSAGISDDSWTRAEDVQAGLLISDLTNPFGSQILLLNLPQPEMTLDNISKQA
jgi:hypothetical protein